MDYKIIITTKKGKIEAMSELEHEVRKYIEEGWKPQGGITVITAPGEISYDTIFYSFFQAMIKD